MAASMSRERASRPRSVRLASARAVSSTVVEDTRLVSSLLGDWLVRRAQRPVQVVRARVGRQRLVYLLGPEANKRIFGHGERFRVGQAVASLAVVDGRTAGVRSS